MLTSHREPDWLTMMADGTVKQLNPFSGTEVWTVAGRGNRPLGVTLPDPVRLICQEGRTERLLSELGMHRLDLVLADAPVPSTVKDSGLAPA